jgi:DNA-binding CsgD family transcriptional regulator
MRLLGDPRLLDRDMAARKRLLLANLCALVEGDSWTFSLRPRHGTSFLEEMSGFERAEASQGNTVRDEDSPTARHLSARQISEVSISHVRLARAPGRPPFNSRERRIAQIVLSETAWLHEHAPAHIRPQTGLSPRQRETLVYLAAGFSRGAIAERLHISAHTINDYIKAIYRHYGVNSRAMLTRRLVSVAGEKGLQ